jgi:hypothetical protein
MTINPNANTNDRNLFKNLLGNLDPGDGSLELHYIKEHPDILLMKIRHNMVFDYFYERAVYERCHPTYTVQWQDALVTVIHLLRDLPGSDIIKANKKYILRLQDTNRTLTNIFNALVNEGFELGDPEFLVYSIIARGELSKLLILSNLYVIEDYPGVLDVALRYGRDHILRYFLEIAELDFAYYGKILDFENYKHSPRYMYYHEHIPSEAPRPEGTVNPTKQNYIEAIEIVLKEYHYPVTCFTIDQWCELIRSKDYRGRPEDVISLLMSKLKGSVPLTYNFEEFNQLIFGQEWSDRKCLVQHCLNLTSKLDDLQHRYDLLHSRYMGLLDRT